MPRHGTTHQRGYGRRHQLARQTLAPQVATGRVICHRCDLPILRGQAWDLGHTDDRTAYAGPEHAGCNRSAGSELAKARRRDPAPTPRTKW